MHIVVTQEHEQTCEIQCQFHGNWLQLTNTQNHTHIHVAHSFDLTTFIKIYKCPTTADQLIVDHQY